PEAISLVLGLEGNCIHHPAKKNPTITSSSKVVAAFVKRREEKISEPKIVDGYRAHSIIINFNCNNIQQNQKNHCQVSRTQPNRQTPSDRQ
nr:hypothetical protein [Tanacetum cinerariifolium]